MTTGKLTQYCARIKMVAAINCKRYLCSFYFKTLLVGTLAAFFLKSVIDKGIDKGAPQFNF